MNHPMYYLDIASTPGIYLRSGISNYGLHPPPQPIDWYVPYIFIASWFEPSLRSSTVHRMWVQYCKIYQ